MRASGSSFKDPKEVKEEFSSIPNYHLASKAFDVRHLDRFLVRVNQSDSVNFATEPSVNRKSFLQQQQN